MGVSSECIALFAKISFSNFVRTSALRSPLLTFCRGAKHWNYKYRKLRGAKVLKVDLPDYLKLKTDAKMTPEESRADMKRRGLQPFRDYPERDFVIGSTGLIFEAYVPPEGDGLASLISREGAKQRLTELEKKGKSFREVRKIKSFDEDFDSKFFAGIAQEIFIEAQKLLDNVSENEDRLHELVTERAYPEMVHQLKRRTLRWRYIQALEPPRVVHVRTLDMLNKENLYGQVTVRLHTQQTLAIYDQYGRLMYGHEDVPRDVLEYVVFEKHLADEYGKWRIHGKVTPEWMPTRYPIIRTQVAPKLDHLSTDFEDDSDGKKEEKHEGDELATA